VLAHTRRADVWHVAALWVATAATIFGVVVLLLWPLEIVLPVTRGARVISSLAFTVLIGGLAGVGWYSHIRRRLVQWNYLAIGLMLLIVTWGLTDGALRELAAGNWVWMGVSAGLALGGMVVSDSFLWRGLRRPQ
jgi:hypothetical protein